MKALHKINLFVIIVLFPVCTATAFPKIIWHTGQITLWNKAVLTGNVSYNWLAEMVLIQVDGRMATLSADQVSQFGWFDHSQHKYREFRSLPGTVTENRTPYAFFEICSDGALTVVRRIKHTHGLLRRAFGHPSNFTDEPKMAQNIDQFDYFVQDDSHLVSVDQFHTGIYKPLMTAYDQPLQKYIATHNINSRSLLGRLVIINHYNYLVQQDNHMASFKQYGQALN